MFQYTQAEFLTINKEAILDQNNPRFEKMLAAFMLTNRMHGQLRCKKKNGEFFESEVSATVYIDRDNNKISSIVIKDITEKLKADIEIKQSEIIYKSIFENSMDAVLLTRPSGEILAANPAACQLFGMAELELITVGRRGIVDYKDSKIPNLLYERGKKGHWKGKIIHIKKNGTKFIAETSSVMFLDAQNVPKCIVTIKDITEILKSQEAIKKSESRYKSFFENGINANFICHANGNIIIANQMASNMFGYTVEELCQMNRAQLADMEDPRLIKLIHEKEEKGNAAGIHRMFHKNGQPCEVYISSKIYYDANGEERHAITIKDLSEQQKAEQALAESDNKYRLLFYKSPIPKWIYDTAALKIVDVNEVAVDHYGYTREEFLKLHLEDLRPKEEISKLRKAFEKQRNQDNLFKAGVFIHKKKNGQLISVEISSIPIDYDGKKCKLIIANDVTDIEYALKELALSIERYNYVTKATSDAIWDWDLANSKALWGEGFESIFGYKVSDVNADISFLVNNIHSDDKQRINDEFYKIIKSDLKQWNEEYRFKKADGSYAYVINKVFLIRDTNQRVIRIVGGMRDITEQKEHVTEIIKAIINTQEDERLEIGSELHDNICQILATCKISFKMLEKNITDSDKAWFEQGIDPINLVFKEVGNLSHRFAPNFFKDDTLEDSLKKLVGTFNIEDQYTITFAFDDNFKSHSISREFQLNIYRILQEQMRNILKYAEGKNIDISGRCTTSSLQLIIKDDGIDFNPNTIKSGIGLANMKRRAELFGGKMNIDSDLGNGCSITVDIPLAEIS